MTGAFQKLVVGDERRAVTGAREVLAAALVLSATGALVFQHYVRNAGFYGDDWVFASTYRFAEAPRFLEAARSVGDLLGGRPLFPFLVVGEHAFLGQEARLHALTSIALSVAASIALFVLLRTVGMRRFDALAVALLVLLFPWSDAGRYWPVVGLIGNAAVTLYLVGATLVLRSLGIRDRRRGWLLHGAAIALYLLSLALYETAAGVILGGVLLYRTRASWSRAVGHWAVDLAFVLPLLALSALWTADVRSVASIAERLRAVPDYARAAAELTASTGTPASVDGPAAKALVAALIASVLVWSFVAARRDEAVAYWLRAAVAGVLVLPFAYAPYLGYYLDPLAPGAGNRINVLASVGYALLAYSIVRLLGRWVGGDRPQVETTVVCALTLAIAVVSVVRLEADADRWVDAAERQDRVLGRIRTAFPRPTPGSTIYVFGFDRENAPDVPVFGDRYDLDAAVELETNDPTVDAYPIFDGVRIVCLADRVYPTGRKYGRDFGADYSAVFFLDASSGRRVDVDGADDCVMVRGSFRPGAFWAASARPDERPREPLGSALGPPPAGRASQRG